MGERSVTANNDKQDFTAGIFFSPSRIVRNADINDSDVLLRIWSVQDRRFPDRNGAELLWRPQTWIPRTRDLPHGS